MSRKQDRRFIGLSHADVFLSRVQVSLQRLMQLLDVKGGDAGFDLSSAIVPVVDVTRLLEAEFGASIQLSQLRALVYDAINIAPHALTNRWSYTCPPGKRATVKSALAFIFRETAAAPVGVIQANVTLNRGGTVLSVLRSQLQDNTPGASRSTPLNTPMLMLPGDILTGQTVDTSTGGLVTYQVNATIEEG